MRHVGLLALSLNVCSRKTRFSVSCSARALQLRQSPVSTCLRTNQVVPFRLDVADALLLCALSSLPDVCVRLRRTGTVLEESVGLTAAVGWVRASQLVSTHDFFFALLQGRLQDHSNVPAALALVARRASNGSGVRPLCCQCAATAACSACTPALRCPK